MENKIVTLEEAQELVDFLQGTCPKDMTIINMPNLSVRQAFSVLYYIQEKLELIPDTYELCDGCLELYDSDAEGDCIGDEHFCYSCLYDGIEKDKYKEYQLKWMISHGCSIQKLICELDEFKRNYKYTCSISDLFNVWQEMRISDKSIWVSESDWNSLNFDLNDTVNSLSGYEKYKIKWLIEHGYSLYDLMNQLDKGLKILKNVSIVKLFNIWENEIGFCSQIWANEIDWNYHDLKYIRIL